eukprot:TRINITY_DN62715_c0_g1_i1.p1 TRINITY_DN62715_c0_g1~~TRINITY_DN62715_c0_g1_i1.p1  ORF type:complete len:1401 (+),score=199.79 TRINITY_DN62715_c0_g1_i1:64-4266(+)
MGVRKLFVIDSNTNGKGPVLFAWQPNGNYLAIAGVNRRVSIVDRQGKIYHQIALPGSGQCMGLDWDSTGETLAMLQQNSPTIPLWNFNTKKLDQLDTNMKELTFLKWSKTGPQLAVGTAKGNLLIYNKHNHKKIPIVGKHQKKITCGVWNTQNKLALGAEDKQLTISDASGDLLDQAHMKHEPSLIQFSDMKADERSHSKENTVSVNMGGKTLLLYNTTDQDNPIELAFQARYGNIVSYKWFGDGYILIGFSSGYVVIISTHLKEIGQEVNSIRFHRDNLTDVTYCAALKKGASVGDTCVKIFEMNDLSKMAETRSEKVELENEFGSLSHVEWTEDGQILTVSSRNGCVYGFLTRIPVLHDTYHGRVLYLTSLRELCVKDVVMEEDVARIPIDIEPTFVSLGPTVAAVGMNNSVWYYRYTESGAKLLQQRTYLATIASVALSHEYAAVFMEGKVILHPIEQSEGQDFSAMSIEEQEKNKQRTFPDKSEEANITSVAMTDEFLIYSDKAGYIHYFSLEDWTYVNEYRFDSGLRAIYPNAMGTRVVCVDETNAAYLYNPVNDQYVTVEKFSPSTEKVMWDNSTWGIFVGADSKNFTTFVYSPNTRFGATATAVPVQTPHGVPPTSDAAPNMTERPFEFSPVLCYNGKVVCQVTSGSTVTITLQTHQFIDHVLRLSGDHVVSAFYNNLSLNRLEEAWKIAATLSLTDCWKALGDKALHLLDIDMAVRVYRQLGNPAMVMALERLSTANEKNLLLGHIAMICKDFQEAQMHFQRSSAATLALDMRRDLMHWDQALKLAQTLAPDQIPIISREYAQQLEFRGEFQAALDMFQNGMQRVPEEDTADAETTLERSKALVHNKACHAGITRNTIRMGDLRKGYTLALESSDAELCQECAQIFEELKQFNDAAALYEKAGLYDKAVSIYIKETKALHQAGKLMQHITSPKVFKLFAVAKEKEGSFKDAEGAYEKAGDMDSVVRLNVEHLNNLTKAYKIVRKTKSADAAALVARHCKYQKEYATAIEFLLLAKKTTEAFELAQHHDEMTTYADVLGPNGTNDDYLAIAQYYENKGDFASAGDFYCKCEHYGKALSRYLQCGDTQISKAIEVVGKARNDSLTHTLIDFLMGETDGIPKDPNYIFRLYMALGSYEKAAKTAVIIAKQEQEIGNYRVAHKILFDTFKTLRQHKIRIPSDLKRNLMLLHSYVIVKTLVKNLGDHQTAALMLVRIAKNINKFPRDLVPILTSTVIECQKVGFKASAYEHACVLVRPENRGKMNEKYKRKIETIVRKKAKEEIADPEEPSSPCPFCNALCPDTTLDCKNCKNTIPFCLVTGKHMKSNDWSYCPSCHFPALHSAMETLTQETGTATCPMCEGTIEGSALKKVENPDPHEWHAPGDQEEAEAGVDRGV